MPVNKLSYTTQKVKIVGSSNTCRGGPDIRRVSTPRATATSSELTKIQADSIMGCSLVTVSTVDYVPKTKYRGIVVWVW